MQYVNRKLKALTTIKICWFEVDAILFYIRQALFRHKTSLIHQWSHNMEYIFLNRLDTGCT